MARFPISPPSFPLFPSPVIFALSPRGFSRLAVGRYNSRAMLASDDSLSPILIRARGWLPPALLVLALSTLFVFGGDRSYFNRSPYHTGLSAKNLAVAENLSPADNFRLFRAKRLAEDGSWSYDMYSRFPIVGTALMKLAVAPFDTLSAKLLAARTLALFMFCGAAVFAYLAVARLASSRWIGLAAALIAFSSYYALYFSDEVSNESSMDIFGVMLTFHGMVAFVQDGRFRQLPLKACAALLIGWHVYALLLAFIVFGTAGETVSRLRGRSDFGGGGGAHTRNIRENAGRRLKFSVSTVAALVRSRYAILGAAALAFGIVSLGANLVNEYYVYGGERSLSQLPTAQSALARSGIQGSRLRQELDWRVFARQQLYRAGGGALPYALPWKRGFPEPRQPSPADAVLGVLAVGAALAGMAFAARRHWALWATLALFSFFWAIPMRGNAAAHAHYYEALFYIGVPLTLFGTALIAARRLWGERALIMAAAAAVAVFAVSAFQMGNLDRDGARAEMSKALMADFDAIREKIRGETVEVRAESLRSIDTLFIKTMDYYFTGSVLLLDGDPTAPYMGIVKYVVSRRGHEGGVPLTPQNRFAFLYEVEPFHMARADLRRVESSEPAVRSDFDVYLERGALTYLKTPCGEDDARARFFLSVHPVNIADLPEDRRAIGHDSLNFDFASRGIAFDGKCAIRRQLPHYPIASISTGQWTPGEGEIWSAEINLPLSEETAAHYETVYAAAKSSGKRIIRSEFDVYMDAHALTYVKEPCAESDARGEFFLDVHPVKPEDLAEERRAIGYDDLAFDFSRHGITFNGKCMARREIPGYPIAEISTGMRASDSGEMWSAKINLPLSAESVTYYDAIYQAAASGERLIESDFDVYMEGGTLTFLKAPCANYDTRGRFLLSVYPVNIADIPEDRRELGHASLNFDFAPSGIIFADKCMVSRELPDYPVEKIATGQWIPGGDRLWTGEAAIGDWD